MVKLARYKHAKRFEAIWNDARGDEPVPNIVDMPNDWASSLNGYELILKRNGNDAFVAQAGEKIISVAGIPNLTDVPVLEFYPERLRDCNRELLFASLADGFAFARQSRYWYGHRYKEIEWLLLPVKGEDGDLLLYGVVEAAEEPDARDKLDTSGVSIERILKQSYENLGYGPSELNLSNATRAYLLAMKTKATIGGQRINLKTSYIAGPAIRAGRNASQPSLLFVGDIKDHSRTISMISRLYRLRVALTKDEATEMLQKDCFDLMITTEQVDGGKGLELVEFAEQTNEHFAGAVVLTSIGDTDGDNVEKSDSGSVIQYMVEPVGEHAMRQAVENISRYHVFGE